MHRIKGKAVGSLPGLVFLVATAMASGSLTAWTATVSSANAPSGPVFAGGTQDQTWDFKKDSPDRFFEFWQPVAGKWEFGPDSQQAPNAVLHQSENGRSLALLSSQKTFTNFEFSARLRTEPSGEKNYNWQMGFILRQKDADRYYKLRVTAGNIALLRVAPTQSETTVASSAGQTPTSLASRQHAEGKQMLVLLPLGVSRDSWHTLGIVCAGENMTLKLDGRVLQTVADPAVGSGSLGLFSYNTPACFDDLRLTYQAAPRLTGKFATNVGAFSMSRDHELLIYYELPKDSPVTVQVRDIFDKVFYVLTSDRHSAGINSVAWDGQGLTGNRATPGLYTLELKLDDKQSYRSSIRVDR